MSSFSLERKESVRLTCRRPSCLSSPEFDCVHRARDVLNPSKCLLDVLEVGISRVRNRSSLPVSETIGQPINSQISHHSKSKQTTLIAHRISTPPLITVSAVPSANLFQLSAVPILTPLGNTLLTSIIRCSNSDPVKLPRYIVSLPTVTA